MMKVKTFGQNKAYARNYLNKVKANENIDFCMMTLSFEHHGYVVMYSYKK